MSLLTPSESHAFQSFLSSMDYSQDAVAPEWSMYAPNQDINHADQLDVTQGKEALAKATKDLMSLDPSTHQSQRWDAGADYQMSHHTQSHYNLQSPQFSNEYQYQQPARDRDLFPFLKRPSQSHSQSHSHHYPPQQQHQNRTPHIAPLHTVGLSSISMFSPSSSTTTGPPSSFPLPSHQTQTPLSNPFSRQSPNPPKRTYDQSHSQTLPGSDSGSNKRRRPSPRPAAARPSPSTPQTKPNSNGKSASNSTKLKPKAPTSSNSTATASTSTPQQKPALLSPSQKKANHIQSEQKRRANIRRGYEALCTVVPSLREALALDEQGGSGDGDDAGDGATNKKVRKGRGKGKATVDEEKEKEKMDGRAGPRSENVVLVKTIDYINDLLSERSNLLSRLQRARSLIPPSQLPEQVKIPLWEREWKGGEGKEDGGDDEEDEEEDES